MIKKFNDYSLNESESSEEHPNNLPYKKEYPYICEYKNRTPDPGQCYIRMIDFEKKKVDCTNGMHSYYPSFDEIIIKHFSLAYGHPDTDESVYVYTKVNFN